MHINFKLELDKTNMLLYPSYLPEDIDYWLNSAVQEFVTTRYTGTNFRSKGFQQDQKRTDDLRSSIASVSITPASVDYLNAYSVFKMEYPDDYWYTISDNAVASSIKPCWKNNYTVDGKQLVNLMHKTLDTLHTELFSPLSEYRLHNGTAKPIRIHTDGVIALYTDGNYDIDSYNLTYIKKPLLIDWYDVTVLDTEYTYIPNHAHGEIIRIAVRRALENISEQRVETFASEALMAE